jgi:uncharacterized repeat protein (TIGR01451 family)
MSARGKLGRPWRRRNVFGATVIGAVVVVLLLTVGAASGRPAAQHKSAGLAAASSGRSATRLISRAHGNVSRAAHVAQHSRQSSASFVGAGGSLFSVLGGSSRTLASITGCGADGTIADATGFEDADGNLAIDTAGCMDWNGFTPTWSGTAPFQTGTAFNNGWSFAGATDAFNSTSDSIYAGGVKQDTVCPATVTGKANDKADLAAMYVATQRIGDQTYLMLAWERQLDTTVQSDVFVSFELNQGNVSCGAGSPFVQRTVGDLLVEYNFQSGVSTIDVQEWDGTTWVPLPTPPYEAAVNSGTVTDTIRPDAPVDLTQFEFGEAGVNLSALDLTGNGGKACETFGSVLGSSRTSKSGDTAQLKDFVGPAPFDASTCVAPTTTTTLKNASGDTTIANGSSIPYGSSVYDTATLGNLVSGKTPTGQVQYTFFANGDCSGSGSSAGLVTLIADGSVPPSDTEGPLGAGNYSFDAKYLSGNDPNYSDSDVSACEPFTVLKKSPSISTHLSSGSISVGDSVHDSATLTGATSDAGGTVHYRWYSSLADCTAGTVAAPGGNNIGDKTVTNGVVPDSDSAGPFNTAGTYYFRAFYSGDDNNNSASSVCADETLVVNAAAIHIVKTADAAQVNAGEPIGFTLTVFNSGAGDAHGVKLSDTLPTAAGLSWSIASQGAGWAGSCSIAAGVLSCGGANGVTVPAGTTQAASTFTVHITSPTTTATGGVCPGGSGVVNNTGHVSTTNDGSGDSPASTCVAAPAVHIVKTADAAKVNAGSPIGFTLTVYNDGSGTAHGVKLSDTLPTNAGLSWSVASQGAGWAGSCSIAAGVLSCGGANGVTVPAGTTQAASTFTVHITSPTTGATGGDCPTTGVVNNTGTVSTSNDGSGQSNASTCVQAVVDLAITKSGSPATQVLGSGNITWTMVVTNNGPSTATGVKVSDPMPAGNTFVSASSTQGTCTGGAVLNCDIGTMATGATVTITLVTTPSASGTQTNTVVVSGSRPESNLANNTATATVEVTQQKLTPPPCVAVSRITPGHLIVGRKTTLTVYLRQGGKAAAGFRVRIKGAGINLVTSRSNAQGVIKQVLKMKKKGVITITPLGGASGSSCGGKRIGVRGVFTPPVTG